VATRSVPPADNGVIDVAIPLGQNNVTNQQLAIEVFLSPGN
jgi:hypothetical protein